MSLDELSQTGRAPPRKLAGMREIVRELSERDRVKVADIMTSRCRPGVYLRHEACWRARNELGQSWGQIGRFFDRDHTTAIFAVRAHEKRMGAR